MILLHRLQDCLQNAVVNDSGNEKNCVSFSSSIARFNQEENVQGSFIGKRQNSLQRKILSFYKIGNSCLL